MRSDGEHLDTTRARNASAAALLLGLVACYGLLLAPGLLLTGAFVGPHILLGGLLHLVVGLVAGLLCRKVSNGSRHARVVGITFSMFCLVLCLIGLAEIARTPRGPDDAVPLAMLVLLAVVFASIIGCLLPAKKRTATSNNQ